MQQPGWDGDMKHGYGYMPSDARMNDYEFERDQTYPDASADLRYAPVQSGYVVTGYPEGVVMRNKPNDRPHYPYHTQHSGFDGYPEHEGTRPYNEYVPGGNMPARAAATSAVSPTRALVSGSPQDLYAKVIKPSERDQNMIPRQPHEVDAGRPNYERGPDGSVSSNASFAQRPTGGPVDDRWRPTAGPGDVGPKYQQDVPASRDLNYNISKLSSTSEPSRPSNQPRVYRPGERHIDGTPMFGDPSKDASRQQLMSPNARPTDLPLPLSMRGQYIDELAATKTPHTQHDLMQAKALSEQRHGQPSYFNYPERDTAQRVSIGFDYCVKCLCVKNFLTLCIDNNNNNNNHCHIAKVP